MMHIQLARVTDIPELAMSETDAKTFFQSAQNVLRHYSIAASQKAIDLMTFASVTAIVYTPRAAAIARRIREGTPRRPDAGPEQYHSATLFTFVPNGAQSSPPNGRGPLHPGNGGQPGPAASVEPEIIDIETHGPTH